MYRSEQLDARVADAQRRQTARIAQWKADGFTCEPSSYAERLGRTLTSALGLSTYARLYADHAAQLRRFAGSPTEDAKAILRALPVIGKPESRSIGEEALASRRAEFSNYFETSGTTSRPVPAPKTPVELIVNTVNFAEHWNELVTEDDAALILVNTPQGPAAFQFERVLNYLGVLTFRTWVDTYRNDYGRVLDILATLRPTVYVGPPSQLLNLYEFAARNALDAPRFRLSLVTGERSTPGLKRRLRALTGGSVIEASYGSSETGTIAVATASGGLRLQSHSFILELRDTKTGALRFVDELDDGVGELVITQLEFPSRPLIRYATGDLVRISRGATNEQLVEPLGRATDQAVFDDASLGQEELEGLLWPEPSPSPVFNYLAAITEAGVTLLVTADSVSDEQLQSELAPLAARVPSLRIVRVQQLPATNGLGSALGWKATRVFDLRSAERPELPAALAEALESAYRAVDGIVTAGAA